jgi:hypothetical protein
MTSTTGSAANGGCVLELEVAGDCLLASTDNCAGMGGTGGTYSSGLAVRTLPLLTLQGDWLNGFSPLGSVAESCLMPSPVEPRYLAVCASFERMNEFAMSARARLVPETEDKLSVLEMGESGTDRG